MKNVQYNKQDTKWGTKQDTLGKTPVVLRSFWTLVLCKLNKGDIHF